MKWFRRRIYRFATANAVLDGLLLIPNAVMWQQHHRPLSLVTMAFIVACGGACFGICHWFARQVARLETAGL